MRVEDDGFEGSGKRARAQPRDWNLLTPIQRHNETYWMAVGCGSVLISSWRVHGVISCLLLSGFREIRVYFSSSLRGSSFYLEKCCTHNTYVFSWIKHALFGDENAPFLSSRQRLRCSSAPALDSHWCILITRVSFSLVQTNFRVLTFLVLLENQMSYWNSYVFRKFIVFQSATGNASYVPVRMIFSPAAELGWSYWKIAFWRYQILLELF